MPNDLAAERAILAGICQHGIDSFIDVADIIPNANTFTNESNQNIYKCLMDLYSGGECLQVDIPTLMVTANKLGFVELTAKPEELKYLRGLLNFPIHKENLRKVAARVRRLEIGRLLTQQVDVAKTNLNKISGDESLEHILGLVENPILDFSSLLLGNKEDGPQAIGLGVREYAQYLLDNPVRMIGLPTGFTNYDMAIGGGLRPKTVNLVGARTKSGKSIHCDNVAYNIASTPEENIPVLVLDTEMAKEDHWHRMIAMLSGVTINEVETGKFGTKKEAVFTAIAKLEALPYDYINISGQPFEETLALMRRWVLRRVGLNDDGTAKKCAIFYDYIKLMTAQTISQSLQEYQVLGFLMTSLHNFMVRYAVPCVAYIQLNRDGITKEGTDAASGSDRIIWLCSNFSIFKKKTDEEIAEELAKGQTKIFNRKMVVVVARHGPALEDGDYINMNMKGATAHIIEGQTRNAVFNLKNQSGFTTDGSAPQHF